MNYVDVYYAVARSTQDVAFEFLIVKEREFLYDRSELMLLELQVNEQKPSMLL